MSIARVNFILYVRDQRASAEFYRKALGMEPPLDVPGMTEFLLREGVVLGLMPEQGITSLLGSAIDPASAGGVPRAELYLLVEDPAGCHARALAAGAEELSPFQDRDWGEAAAYCRDPDGHVLAFAHALPERGRDETNGMEP
jgi:uncharacterized protein